MAEGERAAAAIEGKRVGVGAAESIANLVASISIAGGDRVDGGANAGAAEIDGDGGSAGYLRGFIIAGADADIELLAGRIRAIASFEDELVKVVLVAILRGFKIRGIAEGERTAGGVDLELAGVAASEAVTEDGAGIEVGGLRAINGAAVILGDSESDEAQGEAGAVIVAI